MAHQIRVICGLAAVVLGTSVAAKAEHTFAGAKTWFQTNMGYDPRIAIATDAVVVHRHGADQESMTKDIQSWKSKGYAVGRMFFADSDASTEYWKGKWDGTAHDDEVEKDAAGRPVLCAGFRPYMLPTEGWMRYCESETMIGIRAGADAIMPEEPLAHTFSGHEAAFKPMFEKRFGIPWQPAEASGEAFFLTAQLKAELYLELEQRMARLTKEESRKAGREILFFIPVHGVYGSRASHLTSPMGMALTMPELDGYVGQVWTGPVRWALANYSGQDKTFFNSAYALYDYFAAVTAGTNKRMYMLADPVEDDPNHKWSEFQEWYQHCLVAKLMFPDIDTYEVMPWPDRIFMPGYSTGGGTPAPESFRVSLMSALQVLQDVPAQPAAKRSPLKPVGVALGDSALWEPMREHPLDGLYGLMLPLVGVQPVTASVAERWTEPGYLKGFSAIVLSYENFKPMSAETNVSLAEWVKGGGVLVVLGDAGELKGPAFWWTKMGQPSALTHLLGLLDVNVASDSDKQVGKGWVLRRTISPREVAKTAESAAAYRELVRKADALCPQPPASGAKPGLRVERGTYTVAHACNEAMAIDGPVVDVLDPELPLRAKVTLQPGQSGIYRHVHLDPTIEMPQLLHCTHRLNREEYEGDESGGQSRIVVRGPAETPAVVRMHAARKKVDRAVVKLAEGKEASPEVKSDADGTVLFRFPNAPEGATLEVDWKK